MWIPGLLPLFGATEACCASCVTKGMVWNVGGEEAGNHGVGLLAGRKQEVEVWKGW